MKYQFRKPVKANLENKNKNQFPKAKISISKSEESILKQQLSSQPQSISKT